MKVSRATHFACVTGSSMSSVVCRHGGCHLALLGRERARLLQANDSLPMKRIADPSRRRIPRRMSEHCCIQVHTACVSRCCRTGSEACRIFVRRFWGRWRQGGGWAAPDLCTSPHIHVLVEVS